MGRQRKRSGSSNSYKEMVSKNQSLETSKDVKTEKVRDWMRLLLTQRQSDTGKSLLLHGSTTYLDLALLAVYLIRAQQLDAPIISTTNNNKCGESLLQKHLLLEPDAESCYTALHWALYRGDLATILLLLRHASQQQQPEYQIAVNRGVVLAAGRIKQRPMALLDYRPLPSESGSPAQKERLWEAMVTARDAEGFTPGQLLASMQKSELRACRDSLPCLALSPQQTIVHRKPERARQSSFDIADEQHVDDELGLLNQHLRSLRLQHEREELDSNLDEDSHSDDKGSVGPPDVAPAVEYGCELMTFGRAHHCALGVGADSYPTNTTESSSSLPNTNSSFRPQRVQAFAQSEVGRTNGAVAVAAATHHTMVMTKAGEVFTFGLGKGGRLGTGTERHCPLPTLVPLGNRLVVAIAAAENHSLAVTSLGQVWVWGSNRFGQLGIPTTACGGTSASSSPSGALLPRRVDDLKDTVIRAVAAGERHSVALSKQGACFVWGDNSSGQLGLPPRRQHNAKVQMVQALTQKTTVAIAASDFATLALTLPPRDGSSLPINSIYSWGHGNHVPAKVHLQERGRARSNNNAGKWDDKTLHQNHHRNLDSPIAIACAKYHNVAITQNGLVYTWGFHTETLGTPAASNPPNKKKRSTTEATTPQLVEGMLPENGGGLAVAVSASENHTAVLTDTGALYTWGATHGPNILGHEGVRWQPDPKRVPGLYRGVAVAAAKEHICVLVGASFPTSSTPALSLEDLAAQRVAKHVDLFNVLPVLITAERAQNEFLIRHCLDFCKRNMDGVLNVGQRSVMDCYLTEQLQLHVFPAGLDDYERSQDMDARCHPILKDFGLGIRSGRMTSLYPTEVSLLDVWVDSCVALMESPPGKVLLQQLKKLRELPKLSSDVTNSRAKVDIKSESRRDRTVSFGQDKVVVLSKCSLHCTELVQEDTIRNKDGVSDKSLLEERQRGLMKEVRAIRKRLAQISKLEEEKGELSTEQREKLSRKKELQADLAVLEPALSRVEEQLSHLADVVETEGIRLEKGDKDSVPSAAEADFAEGETMKTTKSAFGCEVCGITCSDSSNYSLHMNGRKHRNRLAQVKQEEQERAAALVAAQHQREALKRSTEPHEKPKPVGNAWKNEPKSAITQPVYKLPPPPHSVPSWLAQPSFPYGKPPKPYSLPKTIMAPESQQPAETSVPSQKPSPSLNDINASESRKSAAKSVPSPKPSPSLNDIHVSESRKSAAKSVPSPSLTDIIVAESQKSAEKSVPSPKSSPSLKDIMAAESQKPVGKTAPTKSRNVVVVTSRGNGPSVGVSPQSLKIQQAIPLACAGAGAPPPELQGAKSHPQGSSPWTLNVDSLPTLESPPWAQPVARVAIAHQSVGDVSPVFSLSDFMGPPSPAPKKQEGPKQSARPKSCSSDGASVWGSPQTKGGDGNSYVSSPVKFVKIQDEAIAFKEKQDIASCGENKGKWFMEQRERAGSLKEIQETAEKERIDRLMIEEQFRIEKMILEDIKKQKMSEKEKQESKTRREGNRRKPKRKEPKMQVTNDAPSRRRGRTKPMSARDDEAKDVKPQTRSFKPETPGKPKDEIA